MNHLPLAIASGLLAGVLARFGTQAFTAAQDQFAAGVADARQLLAESALAGALRSASDLVHCYLLCSCQRRIHGG